MKKSNTLPILIISLLILACGKKQEVISPEKKNISESVYASGFVKSKHQYEVAATLNGEVVAVFVTEGASVKKGDPIFEIENPASKYSAENARLYALANDYQKNREKLTDARNAIELAQKRLLNDSLLFVRQQSLWDKNIGSKIELEQKELSFENAKVALKKAKVAYEDLQRQLKLASAQSKNNLKIARSQEDESIVRSAIDGVVYEINVEKGELTASATPLAVIGQKDFLIALNIDEFDIVKIKKGQKVMIRMDSYKSEVFEGEVSRIYPMMNERTRTFKVEAVFTQKPDLLYPNLTLEANIIINEKTNALTIPTRYLLNDSSVSLADGTIQKVKIGLKDYKLTEIVSGINEQSKITLPEK
jgi:HlyD family secretion protein